MITVSEGKFYDMLKTAFCEGARLALESNHCDTAIGEVLWNSSTSKTRTLNTLEHSRKHNGHGG